MLKKQAKAVPQNRKRVKRDIFTTPLEFQRRHVDFEEQKYEEPEMQVDMQGRMGFVPANGGPNQIGNVEDGPVLPDMETSAFQEAVQQPETPPVPHLPVGADVIMDENSGFKTIMPKRNPA